MSDEELVAKWKALDQKVRALLSTNLMLSAFMWEHRDRIIALAEECLRLRKIIENYNNHVDL
jgi:hypothetical protein